MFDKWANKGLFKGSIKETEEAYPGFKYFYDYKARSKIIPKPPLMFIENYDFSDIESSGCIKRMNLGVLLTLFNILNILQKVMHCE